MKFNPLLLTALLMMFFSSLNAQNDYRVLLQTGTITPAENVREFVTQNTIEQKEIIAGHFYRLLQFHQIPSDTEHELIAQTGIQLMEYLPHLTYIAAIPKDLDLSQLETLGVRAVLPISNDLKIGESLINQPYGDWAVFGSEINVMIKYHKNLSQTRLKDRLQTDGIKILKSNGINNFLLARIDESRIDEVAALPYVAYLELESPPGVPDDTEGRSLHRANLLDTAMPSGRKYTGEGINICVRDDGDVGPHIDFQGRQNSDFVGVERGTHGDGVSGIMCGAGNLDPTKRGMAAGANLYVLSYEQTFLDTTLSLHVDHNVLVTNSSYSNGCNAGYTEITATVDQQMNDYPSFLHVFSAGNSNNQDCGYGAGTQWGNITGGHKQGKNVIATANVFADGSLVESSSRGPAHDGRIKPDIAANGQDQFSTDPNNLYEPFGGTSGAAPGIAGIATQLHQAYSDLNAGATADGALIKAVMLNSANDYGNVGPDFKFGWGIVNAYRAALTLEENRYFTGSVAPGATQTHDIEVPAGAVQVKVMTYWRERESAVMVTKALINDLDTRITSSFGIAQPWILNSNPDPNTLDAPATKGADHLNNVEQIVLDDPNPGTYTLEVTGTELPFGTHSYYVVYEFVTAAQTITYPIGGEGMVPGEVERIHWDAHETTGANFIIVYSTDGGTSWLLVGNVSPAARMYEWTVPEEFTGQGRIMIVQGAVTSMSENFTISAQPQNLEVTEVCPDYIRLGYEEVAGATEYEIFVLGEKYMESAGTSATTTFDYPVTDPTQSHWFAVRAIGVDGLASRRTEAIFYDGGLMNCALQNDMSLDDILVPASNVTYSCGGLDKQITVTVTNNGTSEETDISVAVQLDNEVPIEESLGMSLMPGESADHTFSTALVTTDLGNHTISSWVTIAGDVYVGNDTVATALTIVDGAGAANPFQENFESGVFPPANWQLVNTDGANTWETAMVVQRSGEMGTVMQMHNYVYASAELSSKVDEMYTLPVDLTGAPDDVGLSFDLAYTTYTTFGGVVSDQLRIELSTDCGENFSTVIFDESGDDLATVAGMFGQFIPETGSDWRNEVIDLSDYIGSSIVLKFVSTSNFGNNLFIDNINITGLSPQALFTISADEICVGEALTITSISQGGDLGYFWDFGDGAFPPTSTLGGPFDINYASTGTITISLLVTNNVGTSTTSQTFNVIDVPVPDFTYSNTAMTVNFTNTSTWGDTYAWNFGDTNTSDEENPSHTYATEGIYMVTLEVTNDCGTETITYDVDAITTSTDNADLSFDMDLVPNPNTGVFDLVLESAEVAQLNWGIFTLHGQQIKAGILNSSLGTSHHRIEATDLAAGIYMMQVKSDTGFQTIKVVIL